MASGPYNSSLKFRQHNNKGSQYHQVYSFNANTVLSLSVLINLLFFGALFFECKIWYVYVAILVASIFMGLCKCAPRMCISSSFMYYQSQKSILFVLSLDLFKFSFFHHKWNMQNGSIMHRSR
jgi:hypothetical protein